MKQSIFTIDYNIPLTSDVYKMRLVGDTSDITKPGQFINIKLDGFYLRRPISVFDCDSKAVTIIYKVVGEGTEYMSKLGKGAELDILTGLGNGYDVDKCGESVLLIGGGVGVPPMYYLAKKLLENGKKVSMIMGLTFSTWGFRSPLWHAGSLVAACGLEFPDQGSNPGPLP